MKINVYLLFALLLLMAGCNLGPDEAMINDIQDDYERFAGFEKRFVVRFDNLEETNDSLKSVWQDEISIEIAKDAFAVEIWTSLQTEYTNLHRLYEAFLLEYRLELERMEQWIDGLPKTEQSDAQIKAKWKAFQDGFKQNLETEEQIQNDIRKWRETFTEQIRKLSEEFERK